MLMSVIEGTPTVPGYPELAGKRVLITGLTSTCGVDIVRAFAEHKARLVLQSAEDSAAMQTVAEIAAAGGPRNQVLRSRRQRERRHRAVRQGRHAGLRRARRGGQPGGVGHARSRPWGEGVAGVERQVARQLALPFLISQIAANRMSLTLTDGLILNVARSGRQGRSRARGALPPWPRRR